MRLTIRSTPRKERKTISRLAWINAAKINVAPIAPAQLIAIGKAIKAMPKATKVKPKEISEYLEVGLEHDGAGIAIVICMLAAETGGEYAPIDRKVIAGLKVYDGAAVESYEAIALSLKGTPTKRGVNTFAQAYVNNVMPVWRRLRKEHSAQAADNFLAKSGRQ